MWSSIDWSMLVAGFSNLTWQNIVMIAIGLVLFYLSIAKGAEPLLLIPIGFGVILANIPLSGMAAADEGGIINLIYKAGILTEIFPVLIFIGIGAMADFRPMLGNPFILIFGAAGQFGIFITLFIALAIGFKIPEAASISIIGAMDGPTAIYFSSKYARDLLPAISVVAYSYMSLVPIIQPPIMRALTTKKERSVVMSTAKKRVSNRVALLFPLVAGIFGMLLAPMGAPLLGAIMFGNFLKESGAVERLASVAEGALVNIVTLLLGLCVGAAMLGGNFLRWETILILLLGLVAISLDTVTGLMLGKIMYWVTRGKVNPLIGAAGCSAFPMAARVVQREGQKANPRNFLLWHAMGANTGGQVASVMAAAVMLAILTGMGIMPLPV